VNDLEVSTHRVYVTLENILVFFEHKQSHENYFCELSSDQKFSFITEFIQLGCDFVDFTERENMILQKFFIVIFMCHFHFMTAAPADFAESEITTDSSSTTGLSSTILPDTSTTIIDARQNEVDAKFSTGNDQLTTLSDVDKKIESIEADSNERSTESQPANDVEEDVTEKEAFTMVKLLSDESVTTEKQFQIDTTTISNKITHQAEEIQEPTNNNEFERFATETDENIKTESTTMKVDPSTSQIATKVVLQRKPEDKNITEDSELTERAKALQQIKKMLKAHVLRAILTILNDAKKRQIQEQHTSESQVVEETLHAVSGSECECDDDVSTNDEDKVIAFDKNLQRYVYMDKLDYELLKTRSDYVSISNLILRT
jgi:transcriptional regulator of met regulon